MTANLSATKKIAGLLSVCAIVFAGAACTKEVSGKATAAAHETSEKSSEKSTGKSSGKSSDKSSGKSSGKSSSEQSTTSGSSGGDAAQAPDQPYGYTDGTAVKLDAATEKNDISGLLSDEVGRVLPFHIDNKSIYTLDLSSTVYDATVECQGSKEYVFPRKESLVGPESLAAGQKGDYQLWVGLKKADVGKSCTIKIPFNAADSSGKEVTVDVATFEMTL